MLKENTRDVKNMDFHKPNKIIFFVLGLVFIIFGLILPSIAINYALNTFLKIPTIYSIILSISLVFVFLYILGHILNEKTKDNFKFDDKLDD